eukprot:COSAG01_NODE_57436_length_312_cov_0.892019_1_plen_65_part_10
MASEHEFYNFTILNFEFQNFDLRVGFLRPAHTPKGAHATPLLVGASSAEGAFPSSYVHISSFCRA